MTAHIRPLAIVTGAPAGIGYELAICCANQGFGLAVAADQPAIHGAAKDDPAEVAKAGFDAMMQGEADVITGWKNKLQTTMANVTTADKLAERHRKIAEPGFGKP